MDHPLLSDNLQEIRRMLLGLIKHLRSQKYNMLPVTSKLSLK
jgi:hypothetical protein